MTSEMPSDNRFEPMAGTLDGADRALYLPTADTLVCADLHIGRDVTANTELPLGEQTRLPDRLESLVERFSPDEVVLAGDVIHSFDRVPPTVADTFETILTTIRGADASPILLQGNHDPMLSALTDEPIRETYHLDEHTVICHGDTVPTEPADRYLIGHAHPAINIEGKRHPCYLHASQTTQRPEVIVLPAFNALAPGTPINDVTNGNLPSPLIRRIERFCPGVWDEKADELLWFPAFGEFRTML